MKLFILSTALLNFLLAYPSQAATIPWEKDFEVAQKKAQDSGKLLFIDFYHPM